MAIVRKLMKIVSPYDVRDYKIAALKEFPASWELSMPPVKNQRSTNSCVAHACSEVVEHYNYIQQHNDTTFSTEFIYGYRPATYYVGEGMYIRNALNTLRKQGDCPVDVLPGNSEYKDAIKNVEARMDSALEAAYPHRISSYFRLNSVAEIKTALMEYGPVVVSMPWGPTMSLNRDYVISNLSGEVTGYHCVILYGWNEHGWLMQNSWGITWGKKGRCIVPFTFDFAEAWGVTDEIINENLIRPVNNWFIKVFYKVINFFRRIFAEDKLK